MSMMNPYHSSTYGNYGPPWYTYYNNYHPGGYFEMGNNTSYWMNYLGRPNAPSQRPPLRQVIPTPPAATQSTVNVSNQRPTDLPLPSNVKMKVLPFYSDVKIVLNDEYYATPVLRRVSYYKFYVDPSLAVHSRKDYEVLLRICIMSTPLEQNDFIPINVDMNVNEKPCTRVDVRSPMIITELCREDGRVNRLRLTGQHGGGVSYLIRVVVVRKANVEELCQKIKRKSSNEALKFIKKSLGQGGDADEVLTTGHCLSLQCPLGKKQIELPCRVTSCTHIQCFDARAFMQMNECRGKWLCPVCYGPAPLESLEIDGFIKSVLEACGSSVMKVDLKTDGTWMPILDDEKSEEMDCISESGTNLKKRILFIDLVNDSMEMVIDENSNIVPEKETACNVVESKRSRLESESALQSKRIRLESESAPASQAAQEVVPRRSKRNRSKKKWGKQ